MVLNHCQALSRINMSLFFFFWADVVLIGLIKDLAI